MKTNLIKLCAVILLTAQTIAFGQKTEVSVQKGKVIAETGTTSVAVEAGRKAVLAPDKNPMVSVDNPLVDDALKLYKLIEAEKEHSDLKIDSAFILVGKADDEEILGALLYEFPNHGSEATNVLTLGPASIMEGLQVYDLNGNLCQLDVKLVNETTAFYSIHFSEQVQPGEHFKFIGVVDLENMPTFPGGAPAYGKEGPLRYFRTVNGVSNCLNYFRYILPESAILIDSNREIIATDTVDGRVAVTMRNYTGEYADGLCTISFLWPDKDGTTLADIPDKYRGLRNRRDDQNAKIFKQGRDKIRAGIKFEDQSTPLAALLTCLGSAVHKDNDLYAKSKYIKQSPQELRGYVEQAAYWANILDFLSTPGWPDNPGNGYVHPIYLSRKGSMICEFMQPIVFLEGKWYVHDTKSQFGSVNKLEKPSAQEIAAAEAEGYLVDWEVAGPYLQKDKKSTELFDIPFGPELVNVEVPWQPISTEPHEQHPVYLDLDEVLFGYDQAVAYLLTQIVSDKEKPVRLEIYSDDGVKAWLNGKLVHSMNVSRGIMEEPDKVDVTLKKGTNNLMLKVTDDVWAWGAIVRVEPIKGDKS